jgi:hypothetical protein
MPDAESLPRRRRGCRRQGHPAPRSPGQPERLIRTSRHREAEDHFLPESSLAKFPGPSSNRDSSPSSNRTNSSDSNRYRSSSNYLPRG